MQWGKDKLFNKWHWQKCTIWKKRNQVKTHIFIPSTKINFRQIRNLIIKMTYKKTSKEKIWVSS